MTTDVNVSFSRKRKAYTNPTELEQLFDPPLCNNPFVPMMRGFVRRPLLATLMALVLDFMQRGKKGKNMELELVRKPFVNARLQKLSKSSSLNLHEYDSRGREMYHIHARVNWKDSQGVPLPDKVTSPPQMETR